MKFVQLAASLKQSLDPVYLVEGEEAYFRDHAVSAIRAACALSQPMLNEACFEGESLKGNALSAFVGGLYTAPFFDERRFVRVNGLFVSEKEYEAHLKPYFAAPCPSTVLVIVNAGKKQGSAELKRKAGVTYVDCARESEETLSRWLFSLLRKKGLSPDGEAVSVMVRYCAQDAARMKAEADKLAALLGPQGRVTRAVVEENVAKDTEYKIYELTQAASRRDFTAFSEILNELLGKGFDEIAALSSLTTHYRTLCELAGLRGTDEELAALLGMKPYAVKRTRETARRLGGERAQKLYLRLYELSCGAKSGIYGKAGALSSAVAKIFFD